MKHLLLIRHAKSSWDEPGLDDRARPLNERGKKNAPLMGRVLRERGIKPARWLTSPARRARDTAELIAAELGYPIGDIVTDDRLYPGVTSQLLALLQDLPEAPDSLALFGHNPGLTEFLNLLSDAGIDNLPTCGIAAIEFPVDDWAAVAPGTGRLKFFEYPKRYPRREK